METFYGQMTKEQLDKTYYLTKSEVDAQAFVAMCEVVGYQHFTSDYRSNTLIGVNWGNDNQLGWTMADSNFYPEASMTQIDWYPEETKPCTDYLYPLITSVKTSIEEAEAEVSKWSGKVKEGKEELENLLGRLEKSVKDGTGMECRVLRVASSTSTGLCCEVPMPDPIPSGVDIHDYTTWKDGDVIECTCSVGHAAIEGKRYIYFKGDSNYPIGLLISESGKKDRLSKSYRFRFVRRPDYATVLRP